MSVAKGRLQRTFQSTEATISNMEKGVHPQGVQPKARNRIHQMLGLVLVLGFVLVLGLLSFLLLHLVSSHLITWWQSLVAWGGVALLFLLLFVYK